MHFVAAAILSWPAIANRFPIFFADSAAYLAVVTKFYYTLDRPISYGVAIAPFYLLGGLWSIVVGQALFTTWILGRLLTITLGRRSAAALLLVSVLLATLSSLPWFVGQVMPDLFTGLIALIICLLIFAYDALDRWERLGFPILLALLITFHLSHLIIAPALVAGSGLLAWAIGSWQQVRVGARRAFYGVAAAWLLLCSANLVIDRSFRPSLMSSTFLLARLLDAHLAQQTLAITCAHEPLGLCAALPLVEAGPAPGQAYLWDPRSPRRALEQANWHKIRGEEGRIIDRTIHARPAAVLRMAITGWLRQLVTGQSADGTGPCEPCAPLIEDNFPSQAEAWRASRQEQGTLTALAFAGATTVALIMVPLASIVLVIAAKRRDIFLIGLVAVVAGTLIVNAAVCGILSAVTDRYGSRVLWLLPLLGILGLARLLDGRRRTSPYLSPQIAPDQRGDPGGCP